MATILLVEDDASMRLLTTAKLKHQFTIVCAQDGWRPWRCWSAVWWI